jgi:hypothetical protein
MAQTSGTLVAAGGWRVRCAEHVSSCHASCHAPCHASCYDSGATDPELPCGFAAFLAPASTIC